ncbi:Putative peptidase M35, deuterolysin, metallopeptidase, catalytic domain superfamily [Septoria linicola]|uniref:Neutral protease 2 n=1 Tax=Septoria linicola TaxID=215465 RepID=A0A9Q9APN6_9PEZI|nr:putative peptidase M35, deuterolysin, metallopeptidase, catalytic domain superfamily [Septoria linicola]USW49776.1 Putative peptidase M35, deuterolysin, metallopeptidase, catalytic domain superfamily [Septoria linicola]
MKFSILPIAALATLATSTAIDITKRDTPLEVTLTASGNSKVKAAVTNTGSTGYNLFYKGSLLDSATPVDKLSVSGTASKAEFKGALLRMKTTDLTEESFIAIAPGQTIETEVELAELYDVEASDSYTVQATGLLRYAQEGSVELTEDSLAYSSNQITLDIDGAAAAEVAYAVASPDALEKRTQLSTSSCSSTRLTQLRSALSSCQSLANTAATAATSGSATKFQEYFKTTSSSVRSTVAARFRAVASDCGSTTSGRTISYCSDVYRYCDPNVLAYTLPAYNYIAYCDIFYSGLPALSGTCHAQDRATTVLHEETHAPGVYSPGTQDLGYGYADAQSLSSAQAVLNADTYALYANALYVGC